MRNFLFNLPRSLKVLLFLSTILLVFILGASLYLWQINNPQNKPQDRLARAIKEYKAVNDNLKNILPEQAILARTQEGEKWIARLKETEEDLSSGKKEEVKEKLLGLQSRIEFISEADEAYGYNLDQKKDGISDYAERLHQEISTVLKQLQ